MARSKPDTPKKGKKAGAIQKAATVLRCSPRKAVQSAKKLAADEDIAPGKVVKRAATKKSTIAAKASTKAPAKTPAKTPAKAPTKAPAKTPAKGVTKSKASASQPSKSPSPKKAASTTIETEPSPAPKRGRPKKETKAGSVKTKTRTPSLSKVSSRTRSRTPEVIAEVSAPAVDDEWTDSPKKQSPSKPGPKKAAPKGASAQKNVADIVAKAGPGSIRKSIEVLESKTKTSSTSGVRKPSASPARGRSTVVLSPKVRTISTKSIAGSKRGATKSPRKSPGAASSRARSQSPVRKPSTVLATIDPTRRESQSPVRNSPRKSTVRDVLKFQDAINATKRGRSTSPAKKSSTTKDAHTRSPTRSTRARSKSPVKSDTRKSSQNSVMSPVRSAAVQSPKARGRPRASSVGRQLSPIRAEKTRGAASPAKGPLSKLRRTRSLSPKKVERSKSGARKLSDPTPSPGPGRGRGRPKSPTRLAEVPKQAQRRPSLQAAFERRFAQSNAYGQVLKQVEGEAYRRHKDGKLMIGRDSRISEEDETMALERGIRRAELEKSLRTQGAVVPRRSLSATQSQRKSEFDKLPDLLDLDDTPEPIASSRSANVKDRGPKSPQRRRSSGTTQGSPKGSPGRKRSASKSSNKDDDDTPLPKGEPSGKGRGAIHSVTNPEFIPETSTVRKNPFFETLPGLEVWHRRMPHFLPFGETPFMEREMSRQISADLSRGAEKAQSTWKSYLPTFGMGKKSPTEGRPYKSPWALPEVEDSQVDAAIDKLRASIVAEAGKSSSKRKASGQSSNGAAKRARRRSSGNDDKDEYRMSGAL